MKTVDLKTTSSRTISVGEETFVYIVISVIPDPTPGGNKALLNGIECAVSFNPSIIEILGVTEEPFLNQTGETAFIYVGLDSTSNSILRRISCALLRSKYKTLVYPNIGNYAKIRLKGKAVGSTNLVVFDETVFLEKSEEVTVRHETTFNGATITVQ